MKCLALLIVASLSVQLARTEDDNTSRGGNDAGDNNECNDLSGKEEDCSFWTRSGECDRNPGYMLKYCCKSCNDDELLHGCNDYIDTCQQKADGGLCDDRGTLLDCCGTCKKIGAISGRKDIPPRKGEDE